MSKVLPLRRFSRRRRGAEVREVALARGEASASGRGVDADVAELAIERGAADSEAPCDFRHATAIMADGQADAVRLDLLERAQMPFVRKERDAGRTAQCDIARLRADGRGEVALAPREARLARDMREVLRRQAAALALKARTEQHAGKLAHVARPTVAHQHRKGVVADGQRREKLLLREALKQMARESRNVGAPLTERRQVHDRDADPLAEHLVEAVGKGAAGRGDQADVDRRTAIAADWADLARGENAVERFLRGL